MPSFYHLPSVIRLQELAKHPQDFTREEMITPHRIDTMIAQAVGLRLFYAMERVSEPALAALCALAEETQAVKKMSDMQAGDIVNFIKGYESEKRPALHTAMRDLFDARNSSPPAQEAASMAYKEYEKLRNFLSELERTNQCTDMVQIGIGGSELGPKSVSIALEAFHLPGRRVHFLSNIDPDDASRIFQQVDLKKTMVVVVSKSGNTLETLTNEQFVRNKFKQAGLNPNNHFLAVTGQGSPMDDPQRYTALFEICDSIGGRYSVTSMVGGVILAFALGIDHFLEFLRGANAMDKIALHTNPMENLPLLSALLSIWNRNFLSLSTTAIIPYSRALARFPAHLQQLDMESNGKGVSKEGCAVDFSTGPIIWGEPGTNCQHSFYQAIHQGTTVVPIEFLGFKESQYQDDIIFQGTSCQEKLLANLFAQSIALAIGQKSNNPNTFFPGNRPNRILFGQRLDPYTMGAILAYYEHKVTFQGFIWNINSFDQEGVQLGKKLATQMIDQFASLRQHVPIDPAQFPLGAAYLKHI